MRVNLFPRAVHSLTAFVSLPLFIHAAKAEEPRAPVSQAGNAQGAAAEAPSVKQRTTLPPLAAPFTVAAAAAATNSASTSFQVVAPPALPRVEIEIRNTPELTDDYITWAPAPARIRQLAPAAGAATDVDVVLTNDAPHSIPPGRKQPLDGNVAFAASVSPGETATAPKLELTLPASGAWVPFVVAGAYPRASSADKDAVIEVHAASGDNTLLCEHRLMVRIRKDHRTLTDQERSRFLSAVAHLHQEIMNAGGMDRYMYYVYMHRTATLGIRINDTPPPAGLKYFWPDLAHKAPGFITWHRAFLLQFERDLQKDFPDVALPYWIMSEPSTLFTEDFIGSNVISGDPWVHPTFAVTNPLYGWTAPVPQDDPAGTDGLIRRDPVSRDPAVPPFPSFYTDTILFTQLPQRRRYSMFPAKGCSKMGFVDALEQNPRNIGCNWVGEWMRDCATSPRDPVFWVFHTGFDRQWAHWQYLYNRFDPSGAKDSFCPPGHYDAPEPPGDCNEIPANSCVPVNHHVGDKLWPWGGQSGQAATAKGSYPQPDMAAPFLHPFPAASIPGLWPAQDARPTVGDMIDYAGLNPDRQDMGFGYDDTPYGAQPTTPASPPMQPGNLAQFIDASQPPQARLAAAARLHGALPPAAGPADLAAVTQVLHDRAQNESVRVQALHLVHENAEEWVSESVRLLAAQETAAPQVAVEAVQDLSTALMFTTLDKEKHQEIVKSLEKSLADFRAPVRLEALRALASMGHSKSVVVPVLVQALERPGKTTFTPAQAIKGLMSASAAQEQAALIRPHLESKDAATRSAAISALAGDIASHKPILKLLADPAQPEAVRTTAIQALLTGGQDYFDAVLALAANPREKEGLRAHAIATLGAALRTLSHLQVQQVVDRLGALPLHGPSPLENVLAQTLRNATLRLKPAPSR